MGFFQESTLVRRQKVQVGLLPKCGACGLHAGCRSPKMETSGKGRKGILIVAEAPGGDEDETGKQFVGKAGKLLWETLRQFGVLRGDVWAANALSCRPPKNREPKLKEVEYCRPKLMADIKRLNPTVVITLGKYATMAVMEPYYNDTIGNSEIWRGWRIPVQRDNFWLCPTFHPSFILRGMRGAFGTRAVAKYGREGDPVVRRLFDRHVGAAVGLAARRPWDGVPDYAAQVQCVYDDRAAAAAIARFHDSRMIAFDYETNCLKPFRPESQIYCCSVSDGETTIAFPWGPKAKRALRALLTDPGVAKCGSNIAFEQVWTKKMLGCEVANWDWDQMLAAHWLDFRKGLTSVKFQAFARLGFGQWNAHIERFLKADSDIGINSIHKIAMRDLLKYCGIDSLVEYKVTELQKLEGGLNG